MIIFLSLIYIILLKGNVFKEYLTSLRIFQLVFDGSFSSRNIVVDYFKNSIVIHGSFFNIQRAILCVQVYTILFKSYFSFVN